VRRSGIFVSERISTIYMIHSLETYKLDTGASFEVMSEHCVTLEIYSLRDFNCYLYRISNFCWT
jgi:hypothetical protein